MRSLRFEVFDQTGDATLIRFAIGDGQPTDRVLPRGQISELIAAVHDKYGVDSPDVRSFTSPALLAIGEQLYNFLDGEERWLDEALGAGPEALLHITTAEDDFRHLPWELLASSGAYLGVHAARRFTPVRSVSQLMAVADPSIENRPLRVLFMAASPEGVEPVLDFEDEEAQILEATADAAAELVVEESGSLEGLRYVVESYGAGYFDVFHLSGHATIQNGQPLFVMEDEIGAEDTATPEQIAQAIGGRWPRLVFVSGCLTGLSPDQGALPSMSESLVRAGAPTVLGWALPVGDRAASLFAASLYRELSTGRHAGQAVAKARQELHAERNAFWHFLRMYVDASPLESMVTPVNTAGRATIQILPAASDFLDPASGLVKVASRQHFIGRRRLIQRCLKTLRSPMSNPQSHEGLVLSGMGGLGKSTLASRLVERMPTHKRTVLVGRIDESAFRQMVSRITFDTLESQQEAAAILNAPDATLADRVRFLLRGPMATVPALFVFDDFEDGNLEERDGGYVRSPESSEVLTALLQSIRANNSASRVIVTSRFQFTAPTGTRLHVEALETLNRNELRKKLNDLQSLRPGSATDAAVRERAIEVAAGNPRLLEWLDRIIGAGDLDVPALLAAIEDEAAEFRESVLAKELLDAQTSAVRRMLAQVNVVELPIPFETIEAICGTADIAVGIERAAAVGLVESGLVPGTNEPRYLVSNVLRPLLAPILSDDEQRASCSAAARSLYTLWLSES